MSESPRIDAWSFSIAGQSESARLALFDWNHVRFVRIRQAAENSVSRAAERGLKPEPVRKELGGPCCRSRGRQRQPAADHVGDGLGLVDEAQPDRLLFLPH